MLACFENGIALGSEHSFDGSRVEGKIFQALCRIHKESQQWPETQELLSKLDSPKPMP